MSFFKSQLFGSFLLISNASDFLFFIFTLWQLKFIFVVIFFTD